jgi:hypothetical protein
MAVGESHYDNSEACMLIITTELFVPELLVSSNQTQTTAVEGLDKKAKASLLCQKDAPLVGSSHGLHQCNTRKTGKYGDCLNSDTD